jgi:hypothetical protein
MQLNPYAEHIEKYLQANDIIKLGVTRKELEGEGSARYFALLSYVGEHPQLAAKFCGKLYLFFPEYQEADIWKQDDIRAFVHKLNAEFPFLFFLAEKEHGTLKLLTVLECAQGAQEQENMEMDVAHFQVYLKQQLTGIVHMGEKAGFTPEKTQSLVQDVFDYFGL